MSFVKVKKTECLRCGHKWWPRTAKPKECPACKSYKYENPKFKIPNGWQVVENPSRKEK